MNKKRISKAAEKVLRDKNNSKKAKTKAGLGLSQRA